MIKTVMDKIFSFYASLELSSEYEQISNFGTVLTWEKGRVYQAEKDTIYISKDVNVPMAYGSEGNFVGFVLPYSPIGLIESTVPDLPFYYPIERDVDLLAVPKSIYLSFYKLEAKESQKLISFLSYIIYVLLENYREHQFDTRFKLIAVLLQRYLSLREFDTGFNQSISNFIIRKTGMSKSYVFSILSELKKGDYITISRGKLISINKKIPDKF